MRIQLGTCSCYLSHISLSSKYDGFETLVRVTGILQLANFDDLLEDLSVAEFPVANHSATALYRFDDFIARIASEGEASGATVELHRAAQSLLGTFRHGVGFVQDNDLLPTFGQGDFLLGKHFDLVPDYVDASLVGGVQLQDGLFVVGACEQLIPIMFCTKQRSSQSD